jgi:hypothetical protein
LPKNNILPQRRGGRRETLFNMKTIEELNELTGQILDACITVHKEMGPGLLE